ncbi:MAG: hypothetical protein K8T20_07940 [Planctomycetes bacterium]|nr:hypothetical protein [Planctomycetota bacterium]
MTKTALLVAFSALALFAAPDRTVWSSFKPGGTPKTGKLMISGKASTYYALDGDAVSVRVKGPTRLRISVRAHFAKEDPETRDVALSVAVDAGEAKITKLKSKRVKTAAYAEGAEGEAPGSREDLVLDVPEGEHEYVVKTDVKSWGSFAKPSKKKKILRAEMTPAAFSKAAEEVFQERERTWYFGTKDKPVTLEVTGPTTLKVYAALNFDASMRSSTEWKLEASVDGAPLEEKIFKSSRSHTRNYPDEKALVPGQMETFDLKVAEGRHKLELRPGGGQSAAFRVLIPTADLAKGEKKK